MLSGGVDRDPPGRPAGHRRSCHLEMAASGRDCVHALASIGLVHLTCALIGAAVGAVGHMWSQRRRYRGHRHEGAALSAEARETDGHIWGTQVPARLLGIEVEAMDDESLSLRAPLHLNVNVHGTAFAGSLYSIGVLASYYVVRSWMRRVGLADAGYELVAKAGTVRYRRPVRSAFIVACSRLPPLAERESFRKDLETCGKATLTVDGRVVLSLSESDGTTGTVGTDDMTSKAAVEYSIEVCAYRPRSSDQR